MIVGLVTSHQHADELPTIRPIRSLLTAELQLVYHRKYLRGDGKEQVVLPDMARQIGEALLAAGAVNIIDHGPTTQKGLGDDDSMYTGYHTFTVRVTAINPLSSLSNADL